jgi:GT2 family glycosyltransferase
MSNVAVLVLSWNGEKFLDACLTALLAQQFQGNVATLVVDNGSTDNSISVIKSFAPQVALIQNTFNQGFAGGNNIGLRALLAGAAPEPIDFVPDTIVLLNQDTEVAPNWLQQVVEAFQRHPGTGIVGCKIFYPDGKTLQHTGGRIIWPLATGLHRGMGELDVGQYDLEEPVECVTGAAMAVRIGVFESVGLLDASFTPAYYEDTDLCYRARAANYDIIYAPNAQLIHHEGSSLQLQSPAHQRAYHRNRMHFLLKHGSFDGQAKDFVACEAEEIRRWSLSDSLARKHAYFEALLALPEVVRQRHNGAEAVAVQAQLTRMLRQLHHTVVEEERSRRAEAGYRLDASVTSLSTKES